MSGTKPKPMYWLAAVILLSVVASVAHIVAVVTQHWYLVKCTVREDLATPATWHFHVTLWGGHCALGASQDNATRYTCVNLEALLGDGEGGGDDGKWNSPISQIPQYTCLISHNTPFRTEMCPFLF